MLVITLIIPSAIKFAHIFTHHNHKHEVCKGEKKVHLHTLDLDCEFYKFKIANYYYFLFEHNNLSIKDAHNKTTALTYKFLNNHRPLSFSLRGPPFLV